MTTHQLTQPFDVLLLLLRRWRTICVLTVLALGIGVGLAVLVTRWYAASITIIPTERSAGLGGMTGAALSAEALATDIQRIRSVLSSRSVQDAVIEKFALDAHYGSPDREHTRTILAKRCTASVDKESGMVILGCEDTSPELAARMAEFFGEEGNRVLGQISASSAREERKFLDEQLQKTRQEVDAASLKLREFQESYKVIDLPEQSKAVISAMAALKGEIVSKQLELSYLTGFSSDTEANVVQLRHQLYVLNAKLRQLERPPAPRGGSASSVAAHSDFFPPAMTVPNLRFQLEELVREQKTQEALLLQMTERYATVKVDEARDTSTFQILDHAAVPVRPSRPKPLNIVALAGVAGLAIACAWIIVPVWWRRRTSHAAFT